MLKRVIEFLCITYLIVSCNLPGEFLLINYFNGALMKLLFFLEFIFQHVEFRNVTHLHLSVRWKIKSNFVSINYKFKLCLSFNKEL